MKSLLAFINTVVPTLEVGTTALFTSLTNSFN
jgi:hypothetical protein